MLAAGEHFRIPFYVCTRRDLMETLERRGLREVLEEAGVTFVVDTCVVVTPILEAKAGVMMTNSAKFAHYAPANTGYASVFGSLAECVRTARSGRIWRDETLWR